jgi:hypothetical protein
VPSIRVKPQSPGNTHDISLTGKGVTFGIKLEDGARSIQEISATPSNIRITQGGQKFGDFDPSFSHIEMRDWSNGRAREYYVDDPAAFFDGTAWTLTEGQWHQPPMWGWGAGFNENASIMMPGNYAANEVWFAQAAGIRVDFRPLLSTQHLARKVTSTLSSVHSTFTSSAITPAYINLVARRFGNPPNLNVRLYAGGASRPDSSNSTDSDTISATNVEEYLIGTPRNDSIFVTPPTLSSSPSSIWVEIFTTVASALGNHWEIGYTSQALSTSGSPSTVWAASGDGTSDGWSTGRDYFYLRMFDTPPPRKWHFFELQRSLYAAAAYSAGDRPEIYINGDRGMASSDSNSITLITATQLYSWSRNQWLGFGGANSVHDARIAVVAGTGAGQNRQIQIASTGSSGSSVQVSPNWDVIPTSDSEWVIYNTHRWRLLSTALVSSIGSTQVQLRSVTVADDVAYFGFGNSDAIGRLTWNSSLHQSAKNTTAGSSIADILQTFHGSTAGTQVWRAVSSAGAVSYATAQDLSTEVTFGGSIPVGDASYRFTNLLPYDGVMYAFKEDSVWSISQTSASSGAATKLEFGTKAFTSTNTGRAVLAQNLHLYFSLSHSLERFYRSGSANEGTVDDIGPWQLAGLPRGRNGPISALAPIIGWTAAGVDPSTGGAGAVLLWNNRGWHEIFRASTGLAPDRTMIQNLFFQSNPGGNPKLWMDVGGQIMQISFPKDTLNPLNDEGNAFFWPEGHIITPTIDMGVTQLPKLFHDISVISKDLGLQVPPAGASSRSREVLAEYQLDEDVGSTRWTSIAPFVLSPSDTSPINRGDKKQIRFRFRALTNHTEFPTRVDAMVLKSVARTPVKRQWNVRAEISAFSVNAQGLPDAKPDDFYDWIQEAAESAVPLNMHAAWKAMDNVEVFAEPPVVLREFSTPDGSWGAVLQLTLREI